MKNTFFIPISFIFTSLAFISGANAACEAIERNIIEIERTELRELNTDKAQVTLYNFRLKECASFNLTDKNIDTSAFLPSDETTLGLYQTYRNNGDNQIDALKHTLEFNINEQQS